MHLFILELTFDPSNILEYEKSFEMAMKRTYGNHIPENPVPPTFGGRFHRNKLLLTPKGAGLNDRILCTLFHDFPTLEYCPFVPPLCALVCHHANTADDALGMMVAVVKTSLGKRSALVDEKNKSDEDRWPYFPTTKKETKQLRTIFENILSKQYPKLGKYLTDVFASELEPFYMRWFTDFFIDVLPLPLIFRFLDSFFIEGYKVSIRLATALLSTHKDSILSIDTKQNTPTAITSKIMAAITTSLQQPSYQESVFKLTHGLSIKKSDILSAKSKSSGSSSSSKPAGLSESSSGEEIDQSVYRYQRAQPKLRHGSTILTEELWLALWSWVPPKLRLSELELVFTTNDHGYHLRTLLERVKGRAPTILVIKTLDNKIFGTFLSSSWPSYEESNGTFSGNGETFLFTLEPYAKPYYWVGMIEPSSKTGNPAELEEWQRFVQDSASFFFRTTKTDIGIGGGGSDMGLYINGSLTSGTSGRCATFENQPLTGNQTKSFEIKTIEVFCVNST